jgi:hypothetical protein
MWIAVRLGSMLLVGLVIASSEHSSAVLAVGAVVLYQSRDALTISAPLLSSLPARQREKILRTHCPPTTTWWLGMGFSTGLLIASIGLSMFNVPKMAFSPFGLLLPALANVRPALDGRDAHDLLSVLQHSDQSPAGADAASVSPRQAFERADAILAAVVIRNADWMEAQFWLKRGLLGVHDRDTLAWAFVQLGSSYVYGPDRPDFTMARRFWQMAGLLGDRVAICFETEVLRQGLASEPDGTSVPLIPARTNGLTCRAQAMALQ